MDSLILVAVVVGAVLILAGVARMRSRRKNNWDDVDHSVLFSKEEGAEAAADKKAELAEGEFDQDGVGAVRVVGRNGVSERKAARDAQEPQMSDPGHLVDKGEDEVVISEPVQAEAPAAESTISEAEPGAEPAPGAIPASLLAGSESAEPLPSSGEDSLLKATSNEIPPSSYPEPQAGTVPDMFPETKVAAESPKPVKPAAAASIYASEPEPQKQKETPEPAAKKGSFFDKLMGGKKEEAPVVDDKPAKLYKSGAPDWVIALNVIAPENKHFTGAALYQALQTLGLKHGEMDIFHHYSDGEIVFSLANMVKPGTFDLTNINDTTTPGVSLFMQLPVINVDAAQAYAQMLENARSLAQQLGGELCDETRSVMTQSASERIREQIAEYNVKWLERVSA